jgi:deferrochelatase/peroxidase EfeB
MSLDLADIQGNVLRGYRMANARHFALAVVDAGGARRFVGSLVSGNGSSALQITTAEEWNKRPPYCLNIGFTWDGLRALGLPASLLQLFPDSFRNGPAARAKQLGDVGDSDPLHWTLGGPLNPTVHLVVSLYTDEHRETRIDKLTAELRAMFAADGLTVVGEQDAEALPDGKVHFGYKDGIAQPRLKGAPGRKKPDMQPDSDTGEFLLGKDYSNQYGGNFIGDLPNALCDNATYGALRILRQDCAGFNDFIALAGKRHQMGADLVAAKLLGRWANGVPLTLSPDTSEAEEYSPDQINEFDYAPGPGHHNFFDDQKGVRCPVGAHIRRLNPRSATVMGKPYSRRIIRRGVPYGPAFDPSQPNDGVERGLVGFFICGDLEMQFEFIQGIWANMDFSTTGLIGTRDFVLGSQPEEGGQFVIRTDDGRDPIVLDNLTRFIDTRGSLYCLMPGIGGLRFLSGI